MSSLDDIELPKNYRPTLKEKYMNQKQLAYFKRKLQAWRAELMEESQETLNHLRDESNHDVGDEVDRASRESDHTLELRTRDRYRKLLKKIDQALDRIEEGEYGYCEDTGEEIGIKRLEARPVATLTLEAQERRESAEKHKADDR
ncbi:MAG: RNA polymerase-binding protein DksA [Gammaproteobacteria bacterium]|nr:MAG: RNA polymerase-binding protein DksA [Gammaproteobacteria bacterium]